MLRANGGSADPKNAADMMAMPATNLMAICQVEISEATMLLTLDPPSISKRHLNHPPSIS